MTGYATRAELQTMVDACPADTLAGKRDRLLLVVLRALNGRSRELTALRIGDTLPSVYKNSLKLVVDGEALPIPTGEYTDHDPCELWNRWVSVLVGFVGDVPAELYGCLPLDEYLFHGVTKDGRLRGYRYGLGSKYVGQIVKRAAARARLDNPEQYNARCLRGPARRKVDTMQCEHDGAELVNWECPNSDCAEQYQYGEGP